MDLEKLATSAVSDSISRTDTMSPFVNDGDKEPVWDGHIYIFADKRKTKENIKRVPVQIKGRKCNKQNSDIIKYSLEVAYLKDYLDNGGVMFFVVYISDDCDRKQIYYSALLPIKLRLLLSNIGTQRKKSIELHRFPDDNEDKTTIFLNFFNNMQKQISFAHADLLSEEELIKQGMLEEITFSVTKYGKKPDDIRELIFQDDLYMYAKVKGVSIPQPLEEIPSDIHLADDVNSYVSVNGKKYYNSFKRIWSKEKTKLVIGNSLYITADEKEQKVKFKFKPTDILEDALIDLPFILSVFNYKKIEIGNVPLDLGDIKKTLTDERIETIRHNLEYCNRVSDLFDKLRLNKNKDLSKMNDEDRRNTQRLIDSILDGKPVSGLQKDIPRVISITYMDTKLALVFVPTDIDGQYHIYDYFKDSSFEVFHMIDSDRFPTSKFIKMTADDFLEIGNIDYGEIFSSFLQYSDESYCFEEANFLLLEMIRAYDKSKDKRLDILHQAKIFAEKLVYEIAKSKDNSIAKLNLLQIEKRIHPLTDEQKDILIAIAESTVLEDKMQEYMIRIGANLLLGNNFSAEYYYKMLNEETQEQIKQFPIWRFWKEKA